MAQTVHNSNKRQLVCKTHLTKSRPRYCGKVWQFLDNFVKLCHIVDDLSAHNTKVGTILEESCSGARGTWSEREDLG